MGRPLTPDALVYDLTRASEPRVSPDGRAVVYTLTTTDRADEDDQRPSCGGRDDRRRRRPPADLERRAATAARAGRRMAARSRSSPTACTGSGMFVLAGSTAARRAR